MRSTVARRSSSPASFRSCGPSCPSSLALRAWDTATSPRTTSPVESAGFVDDSGRLLSRQGVRPRARQAHRESDHRHRLPVRVAHDRRVSEGAFTSQKGHDRGLTDRSPRRLSAGSLNQGLSRARMQVCFGFWPASLASVKPQSQAVAPCRRSHPDLHPAAMWPACGSHSTERSMLGGDRTGEANDG